MISEGGRQTTCRFKKSCEESMSRKKKKHNILKWKMGQVTGLRKVHGDMAHIGEHNDFDIINGNKNN